MRLRNNLTLRIALSALLAHALSYAAGGIPARPVPPDPFELLDAALNPSETSYEGRLMVTHWFGKQTRAEEVKVAYSPPNRYRWEFLDPVGNVERIVTSDGAQELVEFVKRHKALKGNSVKSGSKLMSEETEHELLLKNYTASITGADKAVGRPVWILELVPNIPGKQHQKLWVDQQTHVILDSERYRPHGTFTVRSQFTRFEPSKQLPDEMFQTAPDTGTMVEEGADLGQPDFLAMDALDRAAGKPLNLPRELPGGFQFESADFFVLQGHTVRHLRYTDGLTVISLFQTDQPVRTPKGVDPAASAAPGSPVDSVRMASTGRVLQWKSRRQHYTLMSDLSDELMAQIASALGRSETAPSRLKGPAAAPDTATTIGGSAQISGRIWDFLRDSSHYWGGGSHETEKSEASLKASAVGGAPASAGRPAIYASAVAPADSAAPNKWNKVTGAVESFDAASRQLSIKDKSGKLEAFTLSQDAEIRRNKKKIQPSEIRPRDKIKLLRYNTKTHEAQRVVLSSN